MGARKGAGGLFHLRQNLSKERPEEDARPLNETVPVGELGTVRGHDREHEVEEIETGRGD